MGKIGDAKKKAQEAQRLVNQGRDKFVGDIKGLGEKLLKELKTQTLDKLDTKGGKIDKDSAANKKALKEINKRIEDYIAKIGYNKAVADMLQSFDRIVLNTAQAATIANDLKLANNLLTDVQELSRNNAISTLLGDGLRANVVRPVAEVITKQLVLGGDLQSLIAEVEQVLVTNANPNKPALGVLESYATRYGRDTLFQLQGAVNQTIQTNYNLDAYLYVGTEVEDTRPQCSRWVDKEIITIEELESEIKWAYANGKGMIEGTTPANFAIDRGGYNCRHAALPIQKSVYEQSQKE